MKFTKCKIAALESISAITFRSKILNTLLRTSQICSQAGLLKRPGLASDINEDNQMLSGIKLLTSQSCKKATGMRVLPVRKVCKMGSQ